MNPLTALQTAERIEKRFGVAALRGRGLDSLAVQTKWGYAVNASMLGAELRLAFPLVARWQAWHANKEHPHNPTGCFECWCSRQYLVQRARKNTEPWERLSICRIDQAEVIASWSDLQAIKSDVVGDDAMCIEIYPRERDVVNVAQMRHLFVVPDGFEVPCVWRKSP